jgi:periplasmic copper chaperone A
MSRLQLAILAACLSMTNVAIATAEEFKAGSLVIDQPWSRATPKGAKVAAGYLGIKNEGAEADKLVGGSTPAAGKVQIHEMTMKDGVMTMRPVAGGLTIEPGKSVTLAPNGYHVMFMDLKAPFKQGEKVHATLQFERAGKVDVVFDVQSVGAQAPMPMHGAQPGHKM